MGKKIHIERVREFAKNAHVFRARDIETLVGDRGYAALMLHNLVRKGELHRVSRGWYSDLEDPVAAVFAFSPSYLGLEGALSARGFWDQGTNIVLVTPSKAEPGTREVLGGKVIVHRIAPRYFFGFDFVASGGLALPVSDVEKTLIDLVYFGESPGQDVIKRLAEASDPETLEGYLRRYPRSWAGRFRSLVRDDKTPGRPRPRP